MFSFGHTIQARILRTLIFVVLSVGLLTGAIFYVIFEARDSLPVSLVWLILPVVAGVLVLPTGWMWLATRRLSAELSEIVHTLDRFSEQNSMTSEDLRESSQHLSGASREQSAAVQEAVASITQIRSMLAQTSEHVREVQNLTSNVNEKTEDGSQIMARMETAMIAIEQANSQLQSFEEIIRSIREKTQVINDIVFKTQLLSFNASIEAARAGQYGRGFAVVAEEVGKLAQLSGSASKDIDQLLSDSQRRVTHIVEAVEERVRDGKTVSGEALKRFGEIAGRIMIISEKMNQVGEATLEQESGVEQAARAMDQMGATALDSKKAADQILGIAERMRHLSLKIREVTAGIRRYVREDGLSHPSSEADLERLASEVGRSANPSPPGGPHVLSLVNRLARKSGRTKDISADDPSFRKSK